MSSKRGFAQKVDANQASIVKALRAHDVYVCITGQPFDLCVARAGKWYWLEVKDGDKTHSQQQLTDAQINRIADLRNRGDVFLVRTPEEALAAVGIIA